jgi:hypothetical protein
MADATERNDGRMRQRRRRRQASGDTRVPVVSVMVVANPLDQAILNVGEDVVGPCLHGGSREGAGRLAEELASTRTFYTFVDSKVYVVAFVTGQCSLCD